MAFNQAIKDGTISGPVVLSRDHHDVSGIEKILGSGSVCFRCSIHGVVYEVV